MLDQSKNEDELKTGVTRLQSVWAASNGFNTLAKKQLRRHSADLIFSKTLLTKPSNTSSMSNMLLYWKVSIGSSAYRKNVVYVTRTMPTGHTHVWGVFGDRKNAITSLSGCVQGTRSVTAGNYAHLNTKEQDSSTGALMDSIGFIRGVDVNTVSTWYRIWYNRMQITLSRLEGNGFSKPYWRARPTDPATYDHQITSINRYSEDCALMITGEKVIIELSTRETGLIPYINYLLGAGPDTFTWRWGSHSGSVRVPHLIAKTPVGLTYGYMIKDTFDAAPLAVPADPELPGLAEGAVVGASDVVGAWDEDVLNRAFNVLARSMPVSSDIEAACIKASIDVFAESYLGVHKSEVCGADARRSGYNAYLDSGNVPMPRGNHACNIATRLTQDSVATVKALSMAGRCLQVTQTLSGVRALAEMHILPMQLACRQLGLTAAITFAGKGEAHVHHPNVPAAGIDASDRLTLLTNLGCSSGRDPSQLAVTQSMMMEVIFGAVLPESAMFFDYGDPGTDANSPLEGEGNLGECLTSVHAGYVAAGLLQKAAVGLAGIPNGMCEMAGEAKFARIGPAELSVQGESESYQKDQIGEGLPGRMMLGHAILFTSDDELGDDDACKVEVSRFKDVDVTMQYTARSVGVALVRSKRFAYSETPDMDEDEDKAQIFGVLPLYSDFDAQRFSDLRLSLPGVRSVLNYSSNERTRQYVPAFVAASIVDGVSALIGDSMTTLRRRTVKRRKLGSVTSVEPRID